MLKRKERIRSTVGFNGMMIYTPNQEQVCIAYASNEDLYSIRNEPAIFWRGREELFHLKKFDKYSPKEIRNTIMRITVEGLLIILIQRFLNNTTLFSIRTVIGINLLLYAVFYILELSIFKGIHRRKSERGRALLKWRGALNMAINAFEKHGRVPTLEEVNSSSKYRANPDYFMEPHEMVSISFIFIAISFFMPTITIQIISIPILICIAISAYKTSLFGVLRLTYVLAPDLYEKRMARDLVEYWHSISHKDSPNT